MNTILPWSKVIIRTRDRLQFILLPLHNISYIYYNILSLVNLCFYQQLILLGQFIQMYM